jgi:GcrA cell cycle regulator
MFANRPTWTTERVELLKGHFDAGLSCREIAGRIGVTRNAVIGKLARLQLTRGPVRAEPRPTKAARDARENRYRGCRIGCCRWSTKTPSLRRKSRSQASAAARCSNSATNGAAGRSATPGAEDFCFCGNTPVDGMPYCMGHTRLAYRPNSRARVVRASSVRPLHSKNPGSFLPVFLLELPVVHNQLRWARAAA